MDQTSPGAPTDIRHLTSCAGNFFTVPLTAATLGEHHLPISAQDVPYRAEDRTLFASFPAGLRSGGNDAARQTAQRQRLKPDAAGPAKRGEEDSFAAK